jgi:hypothetical protein
VVPYIVVFGYYYMDDRKGFGYSLLLGREKFQIGGVEIEVVEVEGLNWSK